MTFAHSQKEVSSTSKVFFDADFKTFRLYAGNTLYAFCITPELTLEHLYWGVTLPPGFDLRYLSQSSRNAHFNTVEAPADRFGGRIVIGAETLEEVMKTYKESKTASIDESSAFYKRRLENYSWRIMNKAIQDRKANPLKPSFDEEDFWIQDRGTFYTTLSDSPSNEKQRKIFRGDSVVGSGKESGSGIGRRRSVTNPPAPRMNRRPSLDGLYRDNSNDDHDHSHDHTHDDISMLSHQSKPQSPSRDSPFSKFMGLTRRKSRQNLHLHQHRQTFERTTGKMGKGLLCCEYSDHGTGDFRSPSFMVVDNANGSSISPLRYKRHAIYRGKLPMPDSLPGIRCLSEREASTLVVTMADAITGLEVDLVYVAMHDYDAIIRRAVFRNVDSRPRARVTGNNCENAEGQQGNSKVVQKASSMSLDFEATSAPFHLVQLNGSWARERYVSETRLSQGMQSFGSMRGVSGHVQNPFAAVTIGPPSETSGEVRGFSFIYSGNFLVEAEMSEMGRLRCNIGINPMGLQWHLLPAQTFNTPEVVLTRSSEGLGGLSRAIHRLFLDRLLPRNWSDSDPPILLNSWEAKYFHVNHHNIVEMAQQAAKVGINLIVLDDGWFGKRENDTCSLGDWVADLVKFPHGIKGLAEEVNAAGCKFGIWFEPEMVSEDSMLYAAHPDWCLHVPGRPRQLGRNQMVLDLSRVEVRDFLVHSLSTILESANVEYVKWDMNRPLTEVFSAATGTSEVWQAEISHRYMLGVYDLQRRITSAFPHILLENCASGGGRFDPGMLYYSPQIWCSDNTDALTRMKIQYGTSLAYPTRSIGAHVSTVPNHITGSTTRLRTRAFVAMCGTFGYELDISTSTAKDVQVFQRQIEIYRQIQPVVRWGDLYRLWDPFKLNLAAWMYVSRDKSQAVVFAFSLNSDHWSNLVPRLQLQGLLPDAEYEVSEPLPNNITQASGNLMIIETEVPVYQLGVNKVVLTGSILMHAGLPVKFYTLDDSVMFVLTKTENSYLTHSHSSDHRLSNNNIAMADGPPPRPSRSSPMLTDTTSPLYQMSAPPAMPSFLRSGLPQVDNAVRQAWEMGGVGGVGGAAEAVQTPVIVPPTTPAAATAPFNSQPPSYKRASSDTIK